MNRRYVLFLLLASSFKLSFGQKMDEYYVSIDRIHVERLKFLSDSTVELSTKPRHMSPSFSKVYMYTATDSTIDIIPELQEGPDVGLFRQPPFIDKSIRLSKIDGGFIDHSKSLIYVREKDFDPYPDLTYIVNGKAYIQDMGETNSYGLITKSPKTNKALQKKLKTIDLDNCTLEIVKGLNAYRRFGIKKVYGVIVISSKK